MSGRRGRPAANRASNGNAPAASTPNPATTAAINAAVTAVAAAAPVARQIRGPQSALTDFLASQGISANQIRQDADARRAAALASQQPGGGDDNEDDDEGGPSPAPAPAPKRKETAAQAAKRKKEEEKAIAKIKASKQFQRKRRNYGSDDDVTDEDTAARNLYNTSAAPLPGQMDNCEICQKRFSVTGYSKAGPDGGLLCPKCSKEIDKEEASARKKRKTTAGKARRQVQSNLLDGIYPGAKNLVTLCVETLARNVDMADSFGDLPPKLVRKLAAILSKKWLINSTTLDLFLQSSTTTVTVYDGSKLTPDDYIRIFQVASKIKHLRLRNAVQFKNKVMDHLLGTMVELESLSLYGANLIDDERWDRYLNEKGMHLKTLKVYHTDGHFGDEQIGVLAKTCPELKQLKISHNQKVTDEGLHHIAKLSNLTHLALEIYNPTSTAPYVSIINGIGSTLRKLSLNTVHYIDDSVLSAIHDNCTQLLKLRITDNEILTDSGFAALFTDWANPPLSTIDFHKCRHIDASDPRENPDSIGLGSAGFEALMTHSGSKLKHLDVHSCRHISRESFESVFALDKTYPVMLTMNLGFCQGVNDFVCGLIFKACPNLKTLKVFGNFGVRDVRVPKGRILIGVPNALGMQIEGTEHDGEEGRVI